jgi:hypothetical protein
MPACPGATPQLTTAKGGGVDLPAESARPYPGGTWPRPAPSGAWPGQIVVAGAHGGAGASTLAALLDPAWDLGAVVLRRPGRPLPAGLPVVLVARCTVASAWRATAAVSVLADRGSGVAVLAVTGDGLPEPAEAAYRFRVLEGRVGGVVRVPFIPALRAAADPRQVRLARRARIVLAEIRSLADPAWQARTSP